MPAVSGIIARMITIISRQQRPLLWCLFGILFPLLCIPAQALPVDGLYSFELPVQNQSDAERRRAYREALAGVMLKVTGDPRWLQHPQIQGALNNAQGYVEEVSFRTGVRQQLADPEPGDALAEQRSAQVPAMFISVGFSRELIDDLLDRANIPVWDRNRPSVLVWISIQNARGERSLLGSDSEHQILDLIREFSLQRGVPFLIPVLDLTDYRNLTRDQAWSLETEAILQASARYGANSVLAGRLLVTPGGDLVGLWQFIFGDTVDTFDAIDRDLPSYMHSALDRVSTRLAEHYSIVRSTLQSNQAVILRVDGVRNLATHESLLSYVRELSVVRSATVSRLSADGLELLVTLSGTQEHLAEFISLDRDLAEVELLLDQGFLHYRWTR